jgi:hypothetical protein
MPNLQIPEYHSHAPKDRGAGLTVELGQPDGTGTFASRPNSKNKY